MSSDPTINNFIIELYVDNVDVVRYLDRFSPIVENEIIGSKLEKLTHPVEKELFFSGKFKTHDQSSLGQIIIAPTVVAANLYYNTGVKFIDFFKHFFDSMELVRKVSMVLPNLCFLKVEVESSFNYESQETLTAATQGTYFGELMSKGFETVEYGVTKVLDSSTRAGVQISNSENQLFTFDGMIRKNTSYKINVRFDLSTLPKFELEQPVETDDFSKLREIIEDCLKTPARNLFTGDVFHG